MLPHCGRGGRSEQWSQAGRTGMCHCSTLEGHTRCYSPDTQFHQGGSGETIEGETASGYTTLKAESSAPNPQRALDKTGTDLLPSGGVGWCSSCMHPQGKRSPFLNPINKVQSYPTVFTAVSIGTFSSGSEPTGTWFTARITFTFLKTEALWTSGNHTHSRAKVAPQAASVKHGKLQTFGDPQSHSSPMSTSLFPQ